jgi:hypothetical protein
MASRRWLRECRAGGGAALGSAGREEVVLPSILLISEGVAPLHTVVEWGGHGNDLRPNRRHCDWLSAAGDAGDAALQSGESVCWCCTSSSAAVWSAHGLCHEHCRRSRQCCNPRRDDAGRCRPDDPGSSWSLGSSWWGHVGCWHCWTRSGCSYGRCDDGWSIRRQPDVVWSS